MRNFGLGLAGTMLVALLPAGGFAQEAVLRVSTGGTNVSTLDAHRASATDDVAVVSW